MICFSTCLLLVHVNAFLYTQCFLGKLKTFQHSATNGSALPRSRTTPAIHSPLSSRGSAPYPASPFRRLEAPSQFTLLRRNRPTIQPEDHVLPSHRVWRDFTSAFNANVTGSIEEGCFFTAIELFFFFFF
ncbi:hypothetical protein L6164_016566 [Bauhinia variegata]|uniref:Uncharacterized protein n=1 Tax=Bauhinia variegata TaxID=167791 RepID=A0ACB9NRC7_BAUVA|nr:hypothetical protein L6164_016566 [Bauhinia variegata]